MAHPALPANDPVGDLEPAIVQIGERLRAGAPRAGRTPLHGFERRALDRMMRDDGLRSAVFRFVDVRPACADRRDRGSHLRELLADAARTSPLARRAAPLAAAPGAGALVTGVADAMARRVAQRFILGADIVAAQPAIARLVDDGAGVTVDLLGEMTVTEGEAAAYAERCEQALRVLHGAAADWSVAPRLERDALGPLPRVNLSIKTSALTAQARALAPERGIVGVQPRLRRLLRVARALDAHLQVDMETFDLRETVTEATLRTLAEPEFAEGPSAGIVVQGYLREAPLHLERVLAWSATTPRAVPLTVRLVKGAYWDHERIEARRHGWTPPVVEGQRACDRTYELLTRRLVDAARDGQVRPVIASHNLRSISHAIAYAAIRDVDLEFQVLRGLGDETLRALVRDGQRVRWYCPVGDAVAGMAYLVRRLLENASNRSLLGASASDADPSARLEAP